MRTIGPPLNRLMVVRMPRDGCFALIARIDDLGWRLVLRPSAAPRTRGRSVLLIARPPLRICPCSFFLNFGKKGELKDKIKGLKKEIKEQSKALEKAEKVVARPTYSQLPTPSELAHKWPITRAALLEPAS